MKNKIQILKRLVVGGITLSSLLACGSTGSSNDQGVSFTLYGMFSDVTCATGLAGGITPLSSDPETEGSGAGLVAYLGLQNNLAQGLRTRRVYLTYYVEGSDLQPPPTSQALGVLLAPGYTSPDVSLPPGFGAGKSTSCSGFELVPPEILSYLNLNRNRFPELPFKMSVQVSVSGVGTAGDEFTTNPLEVPIEVVQDNIIAPSAPSGDSSSSTGAITDTSGTTDTSGSTDVSGDNSEVIPVIPGTDQPAS